MENLLTDEFIIDLFIEKIILLLSLIFLIRESNNGKR
jgi:hypothetical protein